jgi:hypothetical protein
MSESKRISDTGKKRIEWSEISHFEHNRTVPRSKYVATLCDTYTLCGITRDRRGYC